MTIQLPDYPVSAGRSAATQLRNTAERAAQERDRPTAALDEALAAFEAALRRVDARASVAERVADAARGQKRVTR